MGFRTIALSSDGSKEQVARSLGADDFIDGSRVDQVQALQKLGGMKVIMATAPNARITENLIDALAINGTLLVLAVEPQPMKISPGESRMCHESSREKRRPDVWDAVSLLVKRLSIRGWPAGSPKDAEDCLAFVRAKNIKCLVERFPLHKSQEAFERCKTARFRAVIIP